MEYRPFPNCEKSKAKVAHKCWRVNYGKGIQKSRITSFHIVHRTEYHR